MKKAVFLEVLANVRYWEDATVNGVEDTDGDLIPCKDGDCFMPIINIEGGSITNWELGKKADIHYKVCDAGEYFLLDEDLNRIAKWNGYYVPDEFLAQNGSGYGDYIIFNVNDVGLIKNWKKPSIKVAENDDDQRGWLFFE